MSLAKKCLVIGSTVCDILVYIDELPTTQGDVHVHKQQLSLGGCAYNVVSILHRLDIPYTFISPVGTGVYGDFVKQTLAQQGIQTPVEVLGENGCCYCLVEKTGERTFMSYHQAEYTFEPSWLENLDLSEYAYVYVCGLEVEDVDGDKLVTALQKVSGQIVFAPGPRIAHIPKRLLTKLYAYQPILHLNEAESLLLSGKETVALAVEQLYEWTKQCVIVTLGDKGSVYFDGNGLYEVSGYPTKVVDTIGAGDSHVGAILAALSKGHRLTNALDFANAVASQVVASTGVHLSSDSVVVLQQQLDSYR